MPWRENGKRRFYVNGSLWSIMSWRESGQLCIKTLPFSARTTYYIFNPSHKSQRVFEKSISKTSNNIDTFQNGSRKRKQRICLIFGFIGKMPALTVILRKNSFFRKQSIKI